MSCENVLKPSLLKAFRARLKAMRADCDARGVIPTAPVAAFHATPFHSNLDKIIERGLLAPGDQMAATGEFLPMAHGARWGHGVYCTPDVNLTSCYGFRDRLGRKQALYCLVAPGSAHLLDPSTEEYDYDTWKASASDALLRQYGQHQTLDALREHAIECGVDATTLQAAEESETKRLRRLNVKPRPKETAELIASILLDTVALEPMSGEGNATNRSRAQIVRRYGPKRYVDLDSRPDEEGVFPDGSHTRVSPDRRELVVGSAEQVLPVLLVTFEPVSCWVNRRDLLLWSDPQEENQEEYLSRPLLLFDPVKSETQDKTVAAAEQWWSVSLANAGAAVGTATRVIFVFERTAVEKAEETTARIQACEDIMRELQPEQTAAVVFGGPEGSRTMRFGLKAASALASLVRAPFDTGAQMGLVEGVCAATELALRRHQSVVEDERVQAAETAARNLRTPEVPDWPAQQSVSSFARAVISSCLDRAVALGVKGANTQWVDYSAVTQTGAQHSGTQPSQNWAIKTSVLQKQEAKLTERIAANQAADRDQLYVLVVVPAAGSRHSDREQTEESLRLLQCYETWVRSMGLRSVVRCLSVGSTVTLPLVERLKSCLQTVEHWEPRRVYAAPDAVSLAAVTAEMCTTLRDVKVQKTKRVAVGDGDQQLGCGFVSCLSRP
eukprot:COSAG03_NODE_1879_length_3397_cov_28.414797_2_plen_668_part_01